jgi:probable rRNA maturation factor
MERVVQYTLEKAGVAQLVMLTLLISDDETIRALNKQYRQQDKPTDVLSFPLLDEPLIDAPAEQLWLIPNEEMDEETSEQPEMVKKKPVFVTPSEISTALGDIVISWPTVLKQAQQVGVRPAYELLYLLSHGVLHLVGYDDQTEAGYQAMVQLQQAVLEAVGQKAK